MEQTQTYEEAVLKTVMWWSEKAFKTPLNQNNGDDSPQGGTVFALMNLVSLEAQNKISEEQIKLFEQKLTELLMEKEHGNRFDKILDVDYHPDQKLSLSCEFAGIDEICLPCKTSSYIDEQNDYGFILVWLFTNKKSDKTKSQMELKPMLLGEANS